MPGISLFVSLGVDGRNLSRNCPAASPSQGLPARSLLSKGSVCLVSPAAYGLSTSRAVCVMKKTRLRETHILTDSQLKPK